MDNQLDPQVVAMAKAIRQVESNGNFQAQGKSGEFGAYQFMPDTWSSASQKYLGQSIPLNQATPEQQNQVAYNKIKELKDSGMNVGQVASTWNAGTANKDAYVQGHSGTNSQGVPYDTQAYAQKVAQVYQQFKPQGQTTQSPQPSQTPTLDKVLFGGLAGLGGLALGKAGAVAKGLLPSLGVAGGEALGGPIGAIAGGLAGEGISNLIPGSPSSPPSDTTDTTQPQQPQQPDMAELLALEAEMPQASQASSNLAKTIMQALGTTQSGRVALQDPGTQNAIEAMGRYGFAPSVDANGNQDYSGALTKNNQTISQLSQGVENALQAGHESAPIAQVIQEAKNNVRQFQPSNEWAEADKHIEEQAAHYAQNFGDSQGNIPLAKIERMKREMGPGAKFDATATNAKRGAFKALYSGARNTITNNTAHKEFYNAAMKEEQKLITARRIMRKLNGKKAPVHTGLMKSLLHSTGRMAAIYIGDKIGGPVGAILGNIIEEKMERAINKHHGKTIFETPVLRAAMRDLEKDYPAIYKRLASRLGEHGMLNWLKEQIDFNKAQKLLEAPKSVIGGEYKGGEGGPIPQEQINPKTGLPTRGEGLAGYNKRIGLMQKAAGIKS